MTSPKYWNGRVLKRRDHGYEIRGASIITGWITVDSRPVLIRYSEPWPLMYTEKYLSEHDIAMFLAHRETLILNAMYSLITNG